ncbi:MAG: ABC transporter ATP-binding protein [Myxococcota bacterium]|nr:ABC transporter ATP-binding protein [Myxococcota bacterium]
MTDHWLIAEGVSKMYGAIRALDDIDLTIGPGVTGLLGPNGSGKSTLIKLFAGQARSDTGRIIVGGGDPISNAAVRQHFGLCPEQDRFYEDLTATRFVYGLVRLHRYGHRQAKKLTALALEQVGMAPHGAKRLSTLSRGMRQRVKIAQAIATQPKILLLDEPLTGTDPVGRADLIALFKELGAQGTTVLVSSHVLHEVEAMTDDVIFIRFGRLRARGNVFQLRTLLKDRPYRLTMKVLDARTFGQRLLGDPTFMQVTIMDPHTLEVMTTDIERASTVLRQAASQQASPITELSSPDADLQSVYRYLLEGEVQ